jgi:ABC-2 type transport system ATP-binding protein
VGSVRDVLASSLSASATTVAVMEVAADDLEILQKILKEMAGMGEIRNLKNELLISCDEAVTPSAVNQFCFSKGIVLTKLNLKRKSLESRFLEITGNQSDR